MLLPQEDIELIEDDAGFNLTFASLPAIPVTGRVRKATGEMSVDRELIVNHGRGGAGDDGLGGDSVSGVVKSDAA